MAPTICTDDDKRCRRSIREVRKENSKSSFSVINYVGKSTAKTKLSTPATTKTKKKKLSFSIGCAINNLVDESSTTSISSSISSLSSPFPLQQEHQHDSLLSSSPPPSSLLSGSPATSELSYFSDDHDDDENNRITENDSNSDYNMNENSLDDRPTSNLSASSGNNFYFNHHDEICNKLTSLMNFRYSVKFFNDENLNNNLKRKTHTTTTSTKLNSSKREKGGLMEIALRTIRLIQRNQLLQAKLAQLQVETQAFITSVMANPENKELREQIEKNKL